MLAIKEDLAAPLNLPEARKMRGYATILSHVTRSAPFGEDINSMSTVRFVWLNQRLSHDLASGS